MLIGIDGNEANVTEQVGVSVYTYKLLEYFSAHANSDNEFLIYLKDDPLLHMPKPNKHFSYRIVRGKRAWSQIFLPLDLFTYRKIDRFFSPNHYAPRLSPVKTIITIHDTAYEYFPEEFLAEDLYKLKNWTKYSLRQCYKAICVSNNTKQDVKKIYKTPEKKLHIVYNGYDKIEKNESNILERFSIHKKNYLFHLGTIQPRKNLLFLINAFKRIKKSNNKLQLVIAGKKGWLYEKILSEGQEDGIIFTGYIDQKDKFELYNNALAYVIPSLYEGFGIPLLEAMSCECPVLSSNTSCLPEVGGDACLYFDPKNIDSFINSYNKLLNNNDVRNELIEKGKLRIKNFSWNKTAKETLDVLIS